MSNRNNEDRSGARKSAAPPLPDVVSSTSSDSGPLDFAVPTEFVDLPSQGNFYPEGHPLNGQDSIEIRFMTAKDEDILTSKALLKKGIAIDRLLQSIIVDKTINVNSLLIGDKNALIVAARITGYGSDYQTKVTCPACTSVQTYDFDLLEHSLRTGGSSEEATLDTTEGVWTTVCPQSQVSVGLGLLTGQDEKNLLTVQQKKKKSNLPESGTTDQLRMMIKTVNGSSDSNTINKFINVMPAQDARYLRKVYDKIMPNIDLSQDWQCKDCDFEMTMEVPFTTDFFWPKQ